MTSSSDSSSSEENEHLREALDPSMFASIESSSVSQSKDSLRNRNPIDLNYKNNVLNVTPEFQNFIAKRLTEMLDKTIKECEKKVDFTTSKQSGGIRLLRESKKLLSDKKFVDPFNPTSETDTHKIPMKMKRISNNSIEDEHIEELERVKKAKSVAVSPSWVLNKKGTVGWSKSKGDSFVYRKNVNGEFEIVNEN